MFQCKKFSINSFLQCQSHFHFHLSFHQKEFNGLSKKVHLKFKCIRWNFSKPYKCLMEAKSNLQWWEKASEISIHIKFYILDKQLWRVENFWIGLTREKKKYFNWFWRDKGWITSEKLKNYDLLAILIVYFLCKVQHQSFHINVPYLH